MVGLGAVNDHFKRGRSDLNAQAINSAQEKDLSKLDMTAIDAHTLRVVLANPTPWFLALRLASIDEESRYADR
jgi:hypothetical protein